jgi:hypothetical protein
MLRIFPFALFAGLYVLCTQGTLAGQSAETSCDIITGASCFIEEGCDCDHDGYVGKGGKSLQYCHYDRCPIDGDDNNPNILGIPSENNADGDGWTKNFDCDDTNPCIGNSCEADPNCSPDFDDDGFPHGDDCDDNNPNIYPEALIACCSCEVLASPEAKAEANCEEQPCPGDATATPDAGSSNPGRVGQPYADAVATPPRWASHLEEDAVLGGGVSTGQEVDFWTCTMTTQTQNRGGALLALMALLWTMIHCRREERKRIGG